MNRDDPSGGLTAGRLFLLAGMAALGSLATNIILPAFPQVGADLEVAPRQLAVSLSSFFAAFAFGQLLVGPMSDRFGRHGLVLGGMATFAIGSAICAAAPTLAVLIAGRVVQAVGACAASVLSRAIARDLYDGDGLARALALIMIAMAASPGFSPLAGTVINDRLGWRAVFLVIAVFAMILAWLYVSSLGETHPADRRQRVSFLSVGAAYWRLMRDARFVFPALAVSLIIGGLYTFFSAAPAVLLEDLRLTSLQLAIYFAATVVIVFSAGFAAPRLARRWGHALVSRTGILVALIGALTLLLTASPANLISLTVGLSFFLFGMGMVNPLGTAIALQPFAREAGTAAALLGFLQMGCATLGASLASALPMTPTTALATVMTGASLLSLLAFSPVAQR